MKGKNKPVKISDQLKNLKNIAYRMVQTGDKLDNGTFEDFVNFCKNKICIAKNKYLFDPMWDNYSEEEIIIEYYTLQFSKDAELVTAFENVLQFGDGNTSDNPDFDWMEAEVKKNEEALKRYNEDKPDEFSMSPADFAKETKE